MDYFIGQIVLFAGNYQPRNWYFCNGQAISIASNQALFSILGTQYGGDGRTTFQLPNIDPVKENDGGPAPINHIICYEGLYPTRS